MYKVGCGIKGVLLILQQVLESIVFKLHGYAATCMQVAFDSRTQVHFLSKKERGYEAKSQIRTMAIIKHIRGHLQMVLFQNNTTVTLTGEGGTMQCYTGVDTYTCTTALLFCQLRVAYYKEIHMYNSHPCLVYGCKFAKLMSGYIFGKITGVFVIILAISAMPSPVCFKPLPGPSHHYP